MEPVQEFLSRILIPNVDFGFVWKALEWVRSRFCRQDILRYPSASHGLSVPLISFVFEWLVKAYLSKWLAYMYKLVLSVLKRFINQVFYPQEVKFSGVSPRVTNKIIESHALLANIPCRSKLFDLSLTDYGQIQTVCS
jgi:hypothetical protein